MTSPPSHELSRPAAHALLRLASVGRGYVTDSLILVTWSAITFWNAWFLGRSLLARSIQNPSAVIHAESSVVAGLVVRFACLFFLDVVMYARFAWAPSQVHGEDVEGRPVSQTEAKLRALVAELRRENDHLRLKGVS